VLTSPLSGVGFLFVTWTVRLLLRWESRQITDINLVQSLRTRFWLDRSTDARGRPTHFYLSITYADLQAGLWMHRRAIEHAAIFQRESRIVIWTDNTVANKFAFSKRSTKVGARFSQGKDPLSATNQQNGYAIVERARWLLVF
jgi:hypothetical protein